MSKHEAMKQGVFVTENRLNPIIEGLRAETHALEAELTREKELREKAEAVLRMIANDGAHHHYPECSHGHVRAARAYFAAASLEGEQG